MNKIWIPFYSLSFILLASLSLVAGSVRAEGQQSATPIVIQLTVTVVGTATATPLAGGDHLEPNNSMDLAAPISWQAERGLTLIGDDVDFFTLYLKAGQRVVVQTAVFDSVDTIATLYWGGSVVAMNDDISATDVGSSLVFVVPEAGWLLIEVAKVTIYDGTYDLTVALQAATATSTATLSPTPSPTSSPTATPLPTPTMIVTPFPVLPSVPPIVPTAVSDVSRVATISDDLILASSGMTTTAFLSTTLIATTAITLTVQPLGRVPTPTPPPATTIRLLVYYDANNDRLPGPGEGIANAMVLAVDGQGQRVARTFTNSQGEANKEILLGLPAVRLPIFLPVQNRVEEK